MMAIAMKMERPSTQPWARPSFQMPITRATAAAINRIYKILSSKFSKISSQRERILGILLALAPYLIEI